MPLKYFECPHCKTLVLEENADPTKKEDYEEAFLWDAYENYLRPVREGQGKIILKYLDSINVGKSVLDVGCAAGWFLKLAKECGFSPFGIEPQDNLVVKAKKECPNIKFLGIDMQGKKLPVIKFDIVTLLSVFEHFNKPKDALRIINHLVKPGGELVILTPNGYSLTMKMARFLSFVSQGKLSGPLKTIFLTDYVSKHWFIYNKDALEIFLKKYDFSVLKIQFLPFVDTKMIPGWFLARKIKLSKIQLFSIQFLWSIYIVINKLIGTGDEMLVFAKKI